MQRADSLKPLTMPQSKINNTPFEIVANLKSHSVAYNPSFQMVLLSFSYDFKIAWLLEAGFLKNGQYHIRFEAMRALIAHYHSGRHVKFQIFSGLIGSQYYIFNLCLFKRYRFGSNEQAFQKSWPYQPYIYLLLQPDHFVQAHSRKQKTNIADNFILLPYK